MKHSAIAGRLIEERMYEQVLLEIESGIRRDGLWAKALEKSRGNEKEAKAVYIGLRIQSIKDETEVLSVVSEQHTPTEKTSDSHVTADGFDLSGLSVSERERVVGYANELGPLGFSLTGSRRKWTIQRGTMSSFSYSIAELNRQVMNYTK